MGAQRTIGIGERLATSPGKLTGEERSNVLLALTDDQLMMMMAYISGLYPAVFDEVLAIREPEQLPERLRVLAGVEL